MPVQPFVPATARLPELTLRALILGMVLGAVFGASSLYLVLKVGLTVSASIPVAVIAVALFRLAHRLGAREATILEANIVQTAGSAGESIAFGLGVTLPALLILGFDLEVPRAMLVASLGALLGILMMIPLRHTLMVVHHGRLAFPEGTACAEVLKAAAPASAPGRQAATVFLGFAVGLAYKTANVALKGWKEAPATLLPGPLKGAVLGAEISPELLGVGYIIGPRVAATLCAGGVLAHWVLIPLIKFFGEGLAAPLPPGTVPIAAMGPAEVRSAYLLYIGAGAVAAGGLASLVRILPTLARSLATALPALGQRPALPERTSQDLPLSAVIAGTLLVLAAITFAPPLHMNLPGALLILAFGFLFVTVSARLTGEIGSSSNPVSGMTVATLLITSLFFLGLGWTARDDALTALSVGAIVCIAASNAGATAQDLKTGHLLGATPRLQQLAILAGALVSALLLGPVLVKLNDAATVYVPAAQVAPGLAADPAQLGPEEALQGPQAAADPSGYRTWHKVDSAGGPAGKYLVGPDLKAVWYVDPGINGRHAVRPDGSEVRKFDAPKAVLMSYIVKGILGRELPWGLVLFGAGIALALEMAGVAALPFTVGVYLPLAATLPIFLGGILRRFSDASEGSPGILLSAGYIAGGALAGILIALSAGVFPEFDQGIGAWAAAHNPFFAGSAAESLSLIPYALLAALLAWTGRRASR